MLFRSQCPPHVKGELYIGGVGLAQGYVNREDLNRERFIILDGVRLYRVGDFAMETSDGEFVILGRTDNQIKLHGYRIELEEIEACLKQYPPVLNAVVIVEQEQLLAYLSVSNESYSESDLKDMLRQVLPPYMIPVRFILLDALPLSLGGKVDRQALPRSSIKMAALVSDATALELSLCEIWQNALRCPVAPLDNFFSLGGHSLIAARIVAEIGDKLGKSLTLDSLYHAPTVRSLAYLIEKASVRTVLPVTLPKLGSWFPLTDYQAMFWLCQRFEPGLKVFNMVARRRFQEKLDHELLNKALAFVFEKHQILSYRLNSFYPAQRVAFVAPITWQKTILCMSDAFEEILSTSYDDLFYRHRWRRDQPMIVAKLFCLPEDQTELQVCMSHLIADDRALDIFFEDVCIAYQHYRIHGRAPIQKPIASFAYYATKAHERFQIKQEEKIEFWKTYLADTGYVPMPRKYVVSKMTQGLRCYVTEVDFPKTLLDALQRVCVDNQLTLNNMLTAAVGLALQQCTRAYPHPILINTLKSARTEMRLDETIGCFLEMMVIKLDLKGVTTLLEAAKAVRHSWLEALHYQDIPSLVKYASIGQSVAGLGRVKRAMIRGIMAFYGKLVQRRIKDVRLFDACAKVARQERQRHFFVSVNLLSSFITPTMCTAKMKEIGIPSHSFPVMPLTSVLDVWFYGEHGMLQPKLLVAANLETGFRERFVDTLFGLLQEVKKGE